MLTGPFLWYLNRSTGFVLLVVLTLTLVMGILASGRRPGGLVPAFVTQSLHRTMALLSLVMLVGHVASAVVDTYVDIRWWQVFSPVGATYEPLWLGLGALAVDAFVILSVTSLLRSRLPHRAWRAIHLISYPAWGVAVAHGAGIGTDVRDRATWAVVITAACIAVVAAATAHRMLWLAVRPRVRRTV